ncbi:MAG: phospholipid/cholesterol/gamma-HCH transport system substrate-binding protein [Pseudonocardiales bacterium]|nr:phospholipid/cholesterol/gamma-HCH transport system substrate-binding protein [Pseudonocardiales bacterium]
MTTHMVTTVRRRWVPVLAALVVLALLGWLATVYLRDDSQASVTAVFVDSSPLVPGNKVQLNGVEVGTISTITLVNGQAHVRMSLDRSVLPLHTDATAKIQPVSLLGERFIALGQGSPSAPVLPEPLVIPVTRTGSSVDLDQLLNTLNDPTSTALAAMVTTLGEGLAGQGDKAAQAFKALAPTLHQTDRLSTLLDQQNVVLDHLIVSAQRNATAFAQPLDSLVTGAQQTLGVVAANRQAMNDTLVELPGTLTSARRTLTQLGNTADNTTDVLSGIRPLSDNLVQTSQELNDFADSGRPALRSMPDLLDRVNHMLDEARPVVDDLGPAASDLSSVSGSVRTLNDHLFTHARGVPSELENVMTGAANWAMATSGYDGLSHYFRAAVVVTPTTLANTGLGTLPPIGRQNPVNPVPRNPNGPDVPGSKALPMMPALPNPDGADNSSYSTPKDAPRTAPKGAGQPTDPPSASGLTPTQEGDMFDQLLGGGN